MFMTKFDGEEKKNNSSSLTEVDALDKLIQ